MIEKCPNCQTDDENWDGWDCKKCSYALPHKARKAYARMVPRGEVDKDDE